MGNKKGPPIKTALHPNREYLTDPSVREPMGAYGTTTQMQPEGSEPAGGRKRISRDWTHVCVHLHTQAHTHTTA